MISTEVLKKYDKRKLFDLIKNTGWIFFDRIFRMATGLLVGVWIARYLGPARFGILNYVSVFPLIFTALAGLGLTNILFNEFVIEKNPILLKRLLVSSIVIKFISGVLSFSLVVVASIYIHSDPVLNILVVISATSLIVQSLDVIDIYFQSQKAVHYSIIPKLIVFFIATGFRVFGLRYNYDLQFFIIITAFELLFSSILSFIIYVKFTNLKVFDIQIDRSIIKRLLRLSWPLMISELFLFLYARIDLIMIKQLSTDTEIGNYSVTIRLTDMWYFIPIAITTSLSPSIINMRQANYREYLNRYEHLLNTLATISISIGIVLTLTADYIVELLYGSQYQGVGKILSSSVWTSLFVFLAIGADRWFIVENQQKFVLYRTISGALINIGLNFVLIPRYGAFGAALATLTAQVFASYLMNGLYFRTREIFRLQTNALLFLPRLMGKTTQRVFSFKF